MTRERATKPSSRARAAGLCLNLARLCLYLSLLTPLILSRALYFPAVTGKTIFFRAAVEGALLFFVAAYAFDPRSEEFLTPPTFFKDSLVILLVVFVCFHFFSAFWGDNARLSLFSNFERGEGGIQMLHFLLFFLLVLFLVRSPGQWSVMLFVSICVAVVVCLYGIGQWWEYRCLAAAGGDGPAARACRPGTFLGASIRISGTIGNPIYLAGYLIFQLFFVTYLAVKTNKGSLRVFLVAVAVFFSVCLFMTQVRAALVGFLAGVAVLLLGLGWLFVRDQKEKAPPLVKKFSLAAFSVFLLILLLLYFLVPQTRYAALLDLAALKKALADRLFVWAMIVSAIKEWPWGWGVENLPPLIDRYYDPRLYGLEEQQGAMSFDRAHNLFLDYAAIGGLPLALLFLFLWGLFFYRVVGSLFHRSVDHQSRLVALAFVACAVSYLIQGLTSFDVNTTYQALFLFFALFLNEGGKMGRMDKKTGVRPKGVGGGKKEPGGVNKEKGPWVRWAALCAVLPIVAVTFYWLDWLPWQRARLLADAFKATERHYNRLIRVPEPDWGRFFLDTDARFREALHQQAPVGGEEAFIAYSRLLKEMLMDAKKQEIPLPAGEVTAAVGRVNAEGEKLSSYVPLRSNTCLEQAGMNLAAAEITGDQESYRKAAELIHTVLRLYPRKMQAWVLSLEIAVAKGDREGADSAWRRIHALRPDIGSLLDRQREDYRKRFGTVPGHAA